VWQEPHPAVVVLSSFHTKPHFNLGLSAELSGPSQWAWRLQMGHFHRTAASRHSHNGPFSIISRLALALGFGVIRWVGNTRDPTPRRQGPKRSRQEQPVG